MNRRFLTIPAIAISLGLAACDVQPPRRETQPELPAMRPPPPDATPDSTTRSIPPPLEIPAVQRTVIGDTEHRYPLRRDMEKVDALEGIIVSSERDHSGNMVLTIPLAAREAIWGFGERFDAFNLRGQRLETWTTDGWNRLDSSYFAVPFFISSEGYGLFVNHPGRIAFDIGATADNRLVIRIPDTGVELIAFRGRPDEISRAYTELVGRPRAAPDWIFRPWISRNSYLGAYEVDYVVNRMASLGMPVGVVVLEAWEEQLHNFRFTEHRYPDTAHWIRDLKEKGVHIVCWLTSSVWAGSEAYNQARDQDYLVLNEDGSEHIVRWLENGRKIDFRKPGAFAWWRDLHKPVVALGVDGFKTDGGEHMPDPMFHNQHTYYYQKAALDAFEGSGRDGITFARSANPLNAGLGAYWAGDQEAQWSRLKAVVRGGLSAALSGFPLWTHDIGAYTGNPTRELYIRWLQFGTFSPIMQFHGIEAREPWHFDQETIDIARFYFQIRERLQPMLRTWAGEALVDGTPILRPLIWHFPDDERTRDVEDQFMLGPDLLVAPMTDPIDARGVYLPAGEWEDLWTGALLTGPTQFLAHAPLARLPLFARAESAGSYRGLLVNAPSIEPPRLDVRLAGPADANGMVPVLRYWKGADGVERVYYEIRNNGGTDADTTVALDAPAGFAVEPAAPFRMVIPAGGVQRLAFTVRATETLAPFTYPVRLRVRHAGTAVKAPAVGIVISPSWQVAGLFEGGVGSFQSLDAQPVNLQDTFSGKHARTFGWREVPPDLMDANGRIDLGGITGGDGWSTLFVTTTLDLDRSRTLRFLAGFGDAMTMWINGKEVRKIEGHRNPRRDEDAIEVTLPPGRHRILIRNSRDLSPPQFHFRIVD